MALRGGVLVEKVVFGMYGGINAKLDSYGSRKWAVMASLKLRLSEIQERSYSGLLNYSTPIQSKITCTLFSVPWYGVF